MDAPRKASSPGAVCSEASAPPKDVKEALRALGGTFISVQPPCGGDPTALPEGWIHHSLASMFLVVALSASPPQVNITDSSKRQQRQRSRFGVIPSNACLIA
eukprot:5858826-Amphidinium_carterae.2